MIHSISFLGFLLIIFNPFQSLQTDIGGSNFISSMPLQHEFVDRPALSDGFGAGDFIMEATYATNFPIIIRHDRADEEYLELGQRFADVHVKVTGSSDIGRWRGAGTLIAPNWILTAAHIVRRDGDYEVQVDGQSYRVARIVLNPLFSMEDGIHDIALIELAESVESDRYVHLYRDDDEVGLRVIKVGTGGFGDGFTGFREHDGVLRGATNRVAVADEWHLEFVFDAPGSEHVTELEGISGPGDSGNGALIEYGGRLFIVGVSSHQLSSDETEGKYGVTEIFERVSAYTEWIDQTISISSRSDE